MSNHNALSKSNHEDDDDDEPLFSAPAGKGKKSEGLFDFLDKNKQAEEQQQKKQTFAEAFLNLKKKEEAPTPAMPLAEQQTQIASEQANSEQETEETEETEEDESTPGKVRRKKAGQRLRALFKRRRNEPNIPESAPVAAAAPVAQETIPEQPPASAEEPASNVAEITSESVPTPATEEPEGEPNPFKEQVEAATSASLAAALESLEKQHATPVTPEAEEDQVPQPATTQASVGGSGSKPAQGSGGGSVPPQQPGAAQNPFNALPPLFMAPQANTAPAAANVAPKTTVIETKDRSGKAALGLLGFEVWRRRANDRKIRRAMKKQNQLLRENQDLLKADQKRTAAATTNLQERTDRQQHRTDTLEHVVFDKKLDQPERSKDQPTPIVQNKNEIEINQKVESQPMPLAEILAGTAIAKETASHIRAEKTPDTIQEKIEQTAPPIAEQLERISQQHTIRFPETSLRSPEQQTEIIDERQIERRHESKDHTVKDSLLLNDDLQQKTRQDTSDSSLMQASNYQGTLLPKDTQQTYIQQNTSKESDLYKQSMQIGFIVGASAAGIGLLAALIF